MSARSQHPVRSALALAALLLACAPEPVTAPADGTFRAAIYTRPFESGGIPEWAADSTFITFEKRGNSYSVIAASRPIVAIGPARYVQRVTDVTQLHFGLVDGPLSASYFFIGVQPGRICASAGARDASRSETFPATCRLDAP